MGFGAGMGLPNVRHWADELTIQSRVNEGTSLWASINCKKQKEVRQVGSYFHSVRLDAENARMYQLYSPLSHGGYQG